MKILRIDDKLHESLKQEAKREGRTLQWLVEKKLTHHCNNVHTEPENKKPPKEPTVIDDSQEYEEPDKYYPASSAFTGIKPTLDDLMNSGVIKKGI